MHSWQRYAYFFEELVCVWRSAMNAYKVSGTENTLDTCFHKTFCLCCAPLSDKSISCLVQFFDWLTFDKQEGSYVGIFVFV